jgi:hypothetical protein
MSSMRDFIESRNVERFTAQLTAEIDPRKRAILIALLTEERAKQTGGHQAGKEAGPRGSDGASRADP